MFRAQPAWIAHDQHVMHNISFKRDKLPEITKTHIAVKQSATNTWNQSCSICWPTVFFCVHGLQTDLLSIFVLHHSLYSIKRYSICQSQYHHTRRDRIQQALDSCGFLTNHERQSCMPPMPRPQKQHPAMQCQLTAGYYRCMCSKAPDIFHNT